MLAHHHTAWQCCERQSWKGETECQYLVVAVHSMAAVVAEQKWAGQWGAEPVLLAAVLEEAGAVRRRQAGRGEGAGREGSSAGLAWERAAGTGAHWTGCQPPEHWLLTSAAPYNVDGVTR